MKSNSFYCIPILVWTLMSCGGWGGPARPSFDTPLRPVYISFEQALDIKNLPQQEIVSGESIVWLGDLFFMEEQEKGIHVFQIVDGENPDYLTFIRAPGLDTFSCSGDYLYIRTGTALLTVDISDIHKVEFLNYEIVFQGAIVPPNHNGYFECPDEQNGIVASWEKVPNADFDCRTL